MVRTAEGCYLCSYVLSQRRKLFVFQRASESWVTLMGIFTCKCGGLLHGPCTLQCGHTICKMCHGKTESCKICGTEISTAFTLNTILGSLLERWFPDQYKSADQRYSARKLIDCGKYDAAIEIINQVLAYSVDDHIAMNLRSEAYLEIGLIKKGFRDAQKSCAINKDCGESFFRLGEAYASLQRLDDAVEAFNTCLEVEPEDGTLNEKVCESLDKLLSLSPGHEVDLSDDEDDERQESKEFLSGLCCESCKTDRNLIENTLSSKSVEQKDNTSQCACSKCTEHQCKSYLLQCCSLKRLNSEVDNSVTYICTPVIGNKHCRSKSFDMECQNEKKLKINQPQLEDFECKLCFFTLFQPVTTPCGHSFCKICLERCIDHNLTCPICRGLLEHQESGVGNVTQVIEQAIEHYFPEELASRRKKHEEHMKALARVGKDEDAEVPILTCTLSFPTLQCPLHIFEPSYRMMLRECLQCGSNMFGICQSDKDDRYIDYGTIVEVKHVKFLPDGRSIIDTVGVRRFKVMARSTTDSYSKAKVQYFEDETDSLKTDVAKEQVLNKCFAVYDNLATHIGSLHPTERECIINALGPLPLPSSEPLGCVHGESWVWWATAALPLNDKAKLMMFKSQSLLDRVTILQRFLNFLCKVKPSLPTCATSGIVG